MNPFVQYDNIVPLLAPVDITSTATACPYMDLKGAIHAGFLVFIGALTSATATDTEVVTIQAATAEGGAEAAIAFNYRLSGAVGANTWGAITAAASTGLALDPATHDNMALWIEIDPAALAANDYRVVRVVLTDTPDMANCLVSVVGFIDASYKQTTMISATASASA
jgi:hypothetical protein